MSRRIRLLVVCLVVIVTGMVTAGIVFLRGPAREITAATPPIADVVQNVLVARTRQVLTEESVPFGDDNVINILFLGIDSRKEGKEQHCDAIHMMSVNVEDWTMKITSVPRGTYAYIPGSHAPTEYYMANACAYGGLEYGIQQIEKVIGVQHDYVMTVGFSQALGTFRALGLPTTETLQWLRHRRSYQIGDPQRSHNHAVFMKDMMVKFGAPDSVSTPLLYLLYSFVDTDMEFGTARAIYEGFVTNGIAEHPERVTLAMKPHYETVDYHLDLDNPDPQLAALLDRIRPYTSHEDLSNRTLADVQNELVAYLQDALTTEEGVALVVTEETWRQIEDDAVREELHYAFVESYVWKIIATDKQAATNLVADFILEKQTLGLAEAESKGRALLGQIVVQ